MGKSHRTLAAAQIRLSGRRRAFSARFAWSLSVVLVALGVLTTAALTGRVNPSMTFASASTSASVQTGVDYLIVAEHSGKALDVRSGSTADGAAVVQYAPTGGTNQQWRFSAAGAGYYVISNAHSGKVLDLASASAADGVATVQRGAGGATAQRWKVLDAGGGSFTLVNAMSAKVLDVDKAATTDGAKVQQWVGNNGANQRWTLTRVTGAAASPAPAPVTSSAGEAGSSAPAPSASQVAAPVATTGSYAWQNVRIVGSGYVTGLVFNPSARNVAYARTDMGGAYRWNAATNSWEPITDWIPANQNNLMGIESVATDPVDTQRVYLAAGTYVRSWSTNGALLRSTDRGITFEQSKLPFQLGGNEPGRSAGERLAIDPNQNSTLYLGSRVNGLWRSRDFGVTWSQVKSFPVTAGTDGVGVDFVVFDKSSGAAGSGSKTIYVGVSTAQGPNLYRSTDGGTTWRAVPGQPTGRYSVHAVLSSSGMMYLTYNNAIGPTSITAGALWRFDTRTGVWADVSPATGNYGWGGVDVDAEHPRTVMVTTFDKWYPSAEVYRSTDGGTTWTPLMASATFDRTQAPYLGTIGHWMGTLAIDPFASGHVLYGSGNGVFGSDDVTAADSGKSTHWGVQAQGIEQSAIRDLILPPGGVLISAALDVSGFRHASLTAPQVELTNPSGNSSLDFAQARPNQIVRVGNAGGAYSSDGGVSWTRFTSLPFAGATAGRISSSADGTSYVWAPVGGGGYYTTNRGTTWRPSTGLPNGAVVVADRGKAGTYYALANGSLYVSTNGGAAFSVRSAGVKSGSLKAMPGVAGDLWIAAGSSGLWHSSDAGTSFTKVGGGLAVANGIGFGKAAAGAAHATLFVSGTAGAVSGIFRSTDAGAGWVRINDDQHQYGWLGSLIIGDPNVFGRVYLGTNGRGIIYGGPR